MDGRQAYQVIHKSALTESGTKTQNCKHTSMPPSGRLKENKKEKNPSAPKPLGPPQRSSLVLVPRGVPSSQVPSPTCSRLARTRRERSEQGQPGNWRASPPRLSSRGTGTRALLGDSPSHRKGGSAIRDARESACWALCRPPALTPHTLLSANLPPVRLSTQVLPSFPHMTSKQLRGSLEVLAAGYLAPVARALAP